MPRIREATQKTFFAEPLRYSAPTFAHFAAQVFNGKFTRRQKTIRIDIIRRRPKLPKRQS
ncbi:MAG TPA: hypothetical protein DHU55_10390 [Blastocatellia bacterium]|jgi:hypothetical protein|nr:hypothetical protein [Blastocatellia bacterium]HAF21891.1 hypothetical protein [Blastocatellia bacterium]HCX30160.1 hypothetical protein [Blastocatellia bacterium]